MQKSRRHVLERVTDAVSRVRPARFGRDREKFDEISRLTMTNPGQFALVWLHIVGNLVWIGSILAVAATITGTAGDAKIRGELGLRIYRALSVPAFVLSFVAGVVRLGMDTKYYLAEHHWMHGKLLFAVVVIGIHHVIGARAKKLARGTVQDAGPTATMAVVLLVSAIIAAFFAIFHVPN